MDITLALVPYSPKILTNGYFYVFALCLGVRSLQLFLWISIVKYLELCRLGGAVVLMTFPSV